MLAAAGGILAVAACGDDDESAASSTTTPASTAAEPVDDGAIAKLAATAELLAIDFYTRGIDSGRFEADELGYMVASRTNEQDHFDALAKVLGANEAQHLTTSVARGRRHAGPQPVLPKVLTAQEATAAVTPFLG